MWVVVGGWWVQRAKTITALAEQSRTARAELVNMKAEGLLDMRGE